MPRLFIARHGANEMPPDGAPEDSTEQDFARPLIDAGVDQVRRACAAMKLQGFRPRAILSSPYARTMGTAAIYGDAFGLPVVVRPELKSRGGSCSAFLGDLASGKASGVPGLPNKRMLVVGHHSGLHNALCKLGAYSDDDVPQFDLGEVRCVRMSTDGRWHPLWRYSPPGLEELIPAATHVAAGVGGSVPVAPVASVLRRGPAIARIG